MNSSTCKYDLWLKQQLANILLVYFEWNDKDINFTIMGAFFQYTFERS